MSRLTMTPKRWVETAVVAVLGVLAAAALVASSASESVRRASELLDKQRQATTSNDKQRQATTSNDKQRQATTSNDKQQTAWWGAPFSEGQCAGGMGHHLRWSRAERSNRPARAAAS
jgi:type II secretory pathway pseudopilin PulG